MIKYDKLIWVDPKAVIVKDRMRTNLGDIQDLADRIKTRSLRHPITINREYKLLAGQRRLEALILLGEKSIPAFVNETADPLDVEIDENVGRKSFTPSEAVNIAEKLLERIGSRQGKRVDLDNYQEDTLVSEDATSLKKGEKTRDYIAREVGFGRKTLQNAREVINRYKAGSVIKDVVEAMDSGAISVSAAYDLSGFPKNRQITALNEAVNRPDCSKEALKEAADKRRAAKRTARHKRPAEPLQEQIYSYIRVAPDWDNELVDDIEALPVDGYLVDNGFVAIECPLDRLADAVKIVESWGFEYRNIYTVFDSKDNKHCPLSYVDSVSWHIILAQKQGAGNPVNLGSISPVFDRRDPRASLVEVFESLLTKKGGKRLDMSALEPRACWSVWKIDYAKKEG